MTVLPKGILERMEEDPLRYLYLKEFFLRGAEVKKDDEEGLILINSNRIGYVCGNVKEDPSLKEIKLFLGDSEETAMSLWSKEEPFPVYNLYYMKQEAPVFPIPENFHIRDITMEDMDFILTHYDNPGAFESHIRGRIQYGMLGMEVDGELAAFCGIHEEGTMGMLEVLPKFRRRGIGEILEVEMIRREMEKGYVPYCQVVPSNTASFRLQEKLGLVKSETPVWWFA